jgi:hypothetical protein
VNRVAGCKLDMLIAELNSLSEKLRVLEQSCVEVHTLGRERMNVLRAATNKLAMEEGFTVFINGTCTVKLEMQPLLSCSDLVFK